MTLSAHYEFESVVVLSVDIHHGQSKAGSLTGLVIDRSFRPRPRWTFHELCDAQSRELQQMGVCFCNNDGTLRYADLDGLDAKNDSAANWGGFLQIELVSISEEHRHKDLGVRCVKAVLEWLNVQDKREREEHLQEEMRSLDLKSRLGFGWTLAVLSPGLENVGEDAECRMAAFLRDRPASASARKVTLQWARLGFRQAKFGSDFWFLTPGGLALKSKTDVAELQITRVPKREPLHKDDQALLKYLLGCVDDQGRVSAGFEANVRRLVAQGAEPERAHALHRAVEFGVAAGAHFRLLVSLGANLDGTDELGAVALHRTAALLDRGERTQARAVAAAEALISLGANRSVADVFGDTPLMSVLKQMRDRKDFEGMYGRDCHGRNGSDREKHPYELMITLLEPAQREALLGGVLTPRQLKRLVYYAETKGDEARDYLRTELSEGFTDRVPRPCDEIEEPPCWEYITKEVRGYEVYKSFVGGWCQIFEALREIISPRGTLSPALPTVDAVMRELYQGRRRYDERYLSFFFSNGGKVEHAIDGLLHETADSDVFFDIFGYEEEDGSLEEEYNALPEHPLDDVWDFVRYNILGPKGRVPKGPF